MTGIERIAAERKRQIEVEGFGPDRDEEYVFGELSGAATAYADFACRQIGSGIMRGHPVNNLWRWSHEWWKPSPDPIRNLEKAGALIAAEIDRLLDEKEAQLAQAQAALGEIAGGGTAYPTAATESRSYEKCVNCDVARERMNKAEDAMWSARQDLDRAEAALAAAEARASEYAKVANAAEYLAANAEKHPDACCSKCSAAIADAEARAEAAGTFAADLQMFADDLQAQLAQARAALRLALEHEKGDPECEPVATAIRAALAEGETNGAS